MQDTEGFAWHRLRSTPHGGQLCRGISGSFGLESVAALAWNQRQLCYGISGSIRVEQVAALPWNWWQDSPGIGGSFGVEYALQCSEHLSPVDPLAFFLLRILADHIPTTALPLIHHHFLDPQVLRHLLKTTRALEDGAGDLVTASHRHTHDVLTPARAEGVEIPLRHHARIPHKDASAQF